MRYSQVLLMYAEVMNELAGPDGTYAGYAGLTARQALKEVHCRAFADADKADAEAYVNNIAATQDAMFDAIVDENAWELAGEGVRKIYWLRKSMNSKMNMSARCRTKQTVILKRFILTILMSRRQKLICQVLHGMDFLMEKQIKIMMIAKISLERKELMLHRRIC